MPRLLLADHHRQIEDACRALLARTYADDSRALVAEYRGFEHAMLEHFTAEEEEILPGYAEHAPDDAQAIRADHARFRQLLFRLGVEVELHIIRATTVNQLVDQLHAHAAREDGAMYPWAEAQLSVTARRRLFVRIGRSLRALANLRSTTVTPPTQQPPEPTGYSRGDFR